MSKPLTSQMPARLNVGMPPNEDENHAVVRYSCMQMMEEADKHLDFVQTMITSSIKRQNPDYKKDMVRGIKEAKREVVLIRRKLKHLHRKFNY